MKQTRMSVNRERRRLLSAKSTTSNSLGIQLLLRNRDILIVQGGGSEFYSIQFTMKPASLITLNIDIEDDLPISPIFVYPYSLTFTPDNWDTPQTVRIDLNPHYTPEDSDITILKLKHTVISGDSKYRNMKPLLLPILLFFPQIKYLFTAGENSSNELGHENTKINLITNFPNQKNKKSIIDNNESVEFEDNEDNEDDDEDLLSNNNNNRNNKNKVISISYGMNHIACVLNNNKVYTWGLNRCCQLGINTTNVSTIPIHVPFTNSNIKITKVSCGSHYTLCISKDGKMFGWGLNEEGQIGVSKESKIISKPTMIGIDDVVDVACGDAHNLALCISDGESKVYSWGRGKHGQLGHGLNKMIHKPTLILSLAGLDVFSINCGHNHSAVLVDDGLLYIFGYGGKGQLGRSSNQSVTVPKIIPSLKNIKIRKVCCGGNHTIALGDIDNVYGWGDNSSNQIDDNDKIAYLEPKLIDQLSNRHIISVSCGTNHSLYLNENGNVFYQGSNIGYEEGNMYIKANEGARVPSEINGDGIYMINSGYNHILLGGIMDKVPVDLEENKEIKYGIRDYIIKCATKSKIVKQQQQQNRILMKPKPPSNNHHKSRPHSAYPTLHPSYLQNTEQDDGIEREIEMKQLFDKNQLSSNFYKNNKPPDVNDYLTSVYSSRTDNTKYLLRTNYNYYNNNMNDRSRRKYRPQTARPILEQSPSPIVNRPPSAGYSRYRPTSANSNNYRQIYERPPKDIIINESVLHKRPVINKELVHPIVVDLDTISSEIQNMAHSPKIPNRIKQKLINYSGITAKSAEHQNELYKILYELKNDIAKEHKENEQLKHDNLLLQKAIEEYSTSQELEKNRLEELRNRVIKEYNKERVNTRQDYQEVLNDDLL